MKPRRKVLLYCADAVVGEQMKWLLEVRCVTPTVSVTFVSSVDGLILAASAETFDCCIVHRSKLGETPMVAGAACADAQVYELLALAKCGGVIVELMDGLRPAPYSVAHKLVAGNVTVAMVDVVEAVKTACARKRGRCKELDPRRGFTLAGVADRMVA